MRKFKCISVDESTSGIKSWAMHFKVGEVYDEGDLLPGFEDLQKRNEKRGDTYNVKEIGYGYALICPRTHFEIVE